MANSIERMIADTFMEMAQDWRQEASESARKLH